MSGIKLEPNHCARCGGEISRPTPGSCTTGYGTNDKGEKICYPCCAEIDKQWMTEHGRIALYLTMKRITEPGAGSTVSNWPGSLTFPVYHVRTGRHNFARKRYDVWFNGPDGFVWHGVTYGDHTQICHCKRTKEKIENEA